jgi:hypothetical protein
MSTLVALFHNRWSVPILAELHRQRGSRFVTLARTLGMSREDVTEANHRAALFVARKSATDGQG